MTYEEAKKWREANISLIGTKDGKGFDITDLFIVPEKESERNSFFRSYLLGKDVNAAILPYVNKKMQVWAVDLDHLREDNVLFYDVLAQ